MDARAKMVRDILHAADQYLVPFFQRHYAWNQKHWDKLYTDVIALQEDDFRTQHFLGPLVCTPSNPIPGEITPYQLIDGQQRLTTLILMLAAIRDLARTNHLMDLAEEIGDDYLIHKRQKALKRFKVLPRLGDRDAFFAVIEGKNTDKYSQFNIVKAWDYFRSKMNGFVLDAPEKKLRALFHTITLRLSLVVITIEGENPYEIFESLNSTGLPLEESDLIRNYVFMQVPLPQQEEFQLTHWQPFEIMFDETTEDSSLSQTAFYRSYLMRDGIYSKDKATFQGFKAQNKSRKIDPIQQVEELKQFAQYELWIRRPHTCPFPELGRALEMIQLMEITTCHPLLFNLLDLHQKNKLEIQQLIGCLNNLCSFVLRRTICGESTRTYGKWFSESIREIKSHPQQNLQSYWFKRGWPDDEIFTDRLLEFAIYRREKNKCRMVLELLEKSYGHKEKVQLSGLEIEHVMPQTITSGKHGKEWKQMLGEEWENIQDKWLHTIGNLTLTGYNQTLSSKPFSEKKIELTNSNLSLNRYFTSKKSWTEHEIKERTKKLAKEIIKLWNRPVEGIAYVPSGESEINDLSALERRDLSLEYWNGFIKLVSQKGKIQNIPKPSKLGFLCFDVGWSGVRIFTFMQKGSKNIGVYLRFNKKKAKNILKEIEANKLSIDTRFDNELKWVNEKKDKTSYITLYLPGVDPLNRDQWSDQHNWLNQKLEEFFEYFNPFMK